MTDEELMQAERAMRVRAWDAPKSLPGAYSDAHDRFGKEWAELHRECRRRGLATSTDDPNFRPQNKEGSE